MVSILSAATVLSSFTTTMKLAGYALRERMLQVTGGPTPATKSVPGYRAGPSVTKSLLTIVSSFVENDCHERTPGPSPSPPPHIRRRHSRRHGARPDGALRLLRGGHGRRQGRRQAGHRGVVLPDAVPGAGDRRRPRPRPQPHRGRQGTARPGGQRPAAGAD